MKRCNTDIFLKALKEGYYIADINGNLWNNKNKPLIGKCCTAGYLLIGYKYGDKRYITGKHRVIWMYFNGRIPNDYVINHKNGIKNDNRLSNLECITQAEDKIHAIKNKLRIPVKGEQHGRSKLTNEQVIEVRKRVSMGEHRKTIYKDYPVYYTTINKVISSDTWRNVK